MLRLKGGTHYLALQRSPDTRHYYIAIFERFGSVIASWGTGSRVSPIFLLKDSTVPNLKDQARAFVLFFGPTPPGEVDDAPSAHSFLTLGLFNFVVFSVDEDQRKAARQIAKQRAAPWEEWELHRGRVARWISSQEERNRKVRSQPDRSIRKSFRNQPQTLREPIQEYLAVSSMSVARAVVHAPQLVPDLLRFNRTFRETIDDPQRTPIERHRLFVLANATLSRQSSQTFAGTSPILTTECHYWTHSLLGIGVPSLAIHRIRQFLEASLSRARIVDRLVCLKKEDPLPSPLEHAAPREAFWSKDHLFCYDSQKKLPEPSAPPDDDVLPLMTCFSGRDGFRSTEVSLSAPLEVISNCNVTEWTPLTLTHEVAHAEILGVLGQLLPNLRDLDEMCRVADMIVDRTYPNLFMQLRSFLCYAVWKMSDKANELLDAQQLAIVIGRNWPVLNEILTHCFDFLYFFRGNRPAYIRAVWASWGMVPNIQMRIDEYIKRSLCALHTKNLTRDNAAAVTVEQLIVELEGAAVVFPDSPYIQLALERLRVSSDLFSRSIDLYVNLIRFATFFLYSPSVEQLLFSTTQDMKYFQLNTFTNEMVENPLDFVGYFSHDSKPDRCRSLWLLTQLSFAGKWK